MNEQGLTREQVETIINEGHFYTRGDVVDRARLLAHDASQREELFNEAIRASTLLAALDLVRQERDEYQTKARWKHKHDDSLELELQKQLAAANTTIDSLRGTHV